MRVSGLALLCFMLASPLSASAEGFRGLFSFSESSKPKVSRANTGQTTQRQPLPLNGVPAIEAEPSASGSSDMPGLAELANLGADVKVPVVARQSVAVSTVTSSASDQSVCIAAIRSAEEKYGLPENILLAIGLQEAGREVGGELTVWPWSVNVEGEGFVFDSRLEAQAFVKARLAAGTRSIDVGCMQVNLRWHPNAFTSVEEGFDPNKSADYAAHFLSKLRMDSDSWIDAAGKYHSETPHLKEAYTTGVLKNLEVARARAGSFDTLESEGQRRVAAIPQQKAASTHNKRRFNPLGAPVRHDSSGNRWSRRMDTLPSSRTASNPNPRHSQAGSGAEITKPATGAWWTAEISNSPNGERLAKSIYSDKALEPVLPSTRKISFGPKAETES